MSILDWFRPMNATLADPALLAEYRSIMATGSGVDVNPDNAMRVAAVNACVRVLSETVASLPLKIYKATGEGREYAAGHPLNLLLGQTPNSEQTAMELREWQMTCLGLRGNSYTQKTRNPSGTAGELIPLNPAYMHLSRGADGLLIYDYQEPGNSRVYEHDQIWRVAGLSSDGVTGKSPITLAKESIGVALAAESSAARMYSNGATPSGVLEFDGVLTPETIANMRAQFADNYQGYKNAQKPMILESGMKWAQVGLSAGDSQFLESRKFQIAEIARWYRVPLHMLNELDKATFSNIEHQSIEFVTHTIRPWLVRIEQTIARDLLTPAERRAGFFASHSVEGLLRGDTAARYTAHASAISNGWMNRNEVRKLENLNPVDGLDEYIVQLNMGSAQAGSPAAALAAREINALAAESERKSLHEFAAWLPKFYARFGALLQSDLGATESQAAAYIDHRIDSIAGFSDPVAAVESIKNTIKGDIEAITA